ncbi:MAG: EamA family transporter [Chloroflexota bacterium]
MKKWAAFWALGLIWGSSFLFIRIGVEQLSPFQVVFIRTGIAAIGLNLVLLSRGKHLPLNLKQLRPLIIIGLGNTTIPFALITTGEKAISSGLAAMLQSAASLFTAILAHFFFVDERLTPQKIVGLAVGFIGVIVLGSHSIVDGQIDLPLFLGAMAVVLASLFYATFTIYSRKVIQNRFEPLMVSAGAMTFAAISSGICMVIAPLLGGQAATPLNTVSSDVLIAVGLLGLVNTFITYLIYYWIIRELGAARTSMVTYITPGVGLALGALVLQEPIDWRLLVGALLIFCGIAIVNLRIFSRFSLRRSIPLASEEAA